MSGNAKKKSKDEEGTPMIPVFTVIKNGVILKNIFVVNQPVDNFSSLSSIKFVDSSKNLDREEILIVGRHPDCNIVLMHPSISRFHLQINSNPSLRKLFATDLSSVHGTWISEKKIDPGFRIEMKEGDTLRMGGSTRVYRLHWIPLSRAYDFENPFVSESDLALIREKEEENVETMSLNLLATENKNVEEKDSVLVLEKAVDRYEENDCLVSEKGEIQSPVLILEDVSLVPNENTGLILKEEIPSSMSAEMNSFNRVKDEMESSSTYDNELSLEAVGGVIMKTLSAIFYDCNQSPEYHSAEEDLYFPDSPSSVGEDDSVSKTTKATRSQSLLRNKEEQKVDTSSVQKVDGSITGTAATEVLEESENHNPFGNQTLPWEQIIDGAAATEVIEETKVQSCMRKEGTVRESTIDGLAFSDVVEEKENLCSNGNEGILNEPTIYDMTTIEVLEEADNLIAYKKEGILNDPTMDVPGSIVVVKEAGNQSPSRENGIMRKLTLISTDLETEGYSYSPEILSQSKQTKTPITHFPVNVMGSCDRSEKQNGSCNIWSRRGKPPSALQLWTSRNRRITEGDSELENLENSDSKSMGRELFSDVDSKIEEVQTQNKEKITPNASVMRSLKKNTKIKSSVRAPFSNREAADEEYTPGKENHTPDVSSIRISSSDKENQTTVILQERKSARSLRHHFKLEERAPLQSLSSNSESSFPSSAERSSSSINCNQEVTDSKSVNSVGDRRRRWIMITDTSSLLDKETRGALELLQGLKGTHLIIPRIVIQELDSLKKCNSLFRRKSKASEALQWIEECMLKTKWWIHVENVRPISQTPPATPVSQFCQKSEVFELVTPTAEDQILDCALFYKKMDSERQVALLSNNVTLRIKATAEGLICETAKEFRDSLVNPFSERFLWADSSPRGQTWSVFDDVVLKDNYYRSPSKKLSKGESAKGLKLVLLHNSQFVKSI